MNNILINNLRIRYADFNTEKKQTLLFIHGNSHTHESFTFQTNGRQLKDYRLICLNLPGHGGSDKASEYSIPLFASIVSSFVKELKLENFIIVGHSLGGHVAIESLKEIDPKGLFIFGTPPLSKPLDMSGFLPNPKGRALFQDACTEEDIEDLLTELHYTGGERLRAAINFKQTDPAFRSGIFQSVLANNYSDESKLLSEFGGKLLVLVSQKENLVNNNYVQQIFESNCSKVEFSFIDAGHVPQIENDLAFNEILSEFCHDVFFDASQTSKKKVNSVSVNQQLGLQV